MAEVKELKASYELLKIEYKCKNCDLFKDSLQKMKLTLKELQLLCQTKDSEISRLYHDIGNLNNDVTKMKIDYNELQEKFSRINNALPIETQSFISQIVTLKAINLSQKDQLRKFVKKYCKVCKETEKIIFNCFNTNIESNTKSSYPKFLENYKKIKFTLLSHIQSSLIDEMVDDEEARGTADQIVELLKEDPNKESKQRRTTQSSKGRQYSTKNAESCHSFNNSESNNDGNVSDMLELNIPVKKSNKQGTVQNMNDADCEMKSSTELSYESTEVHNEYMESVKQASLILKDIFKSYKQSNNPRKIQSKVTKSKAISKSIMNDNKSHPLSLNENKTNVKENNESNIELKENYQGLVEFDKIILNNNNIVLDTRTNIKLSNIDLHEDTDNPVPCNPHHRPPGCNILTEDYADQSSDLLESTLNDDILSSNEILETLKDINKNTTNKHKLTSISDNKDLDKEEEKERCLHSNISKSLLQDNGERIPEVLKMRHDTTIIIENIKNRECNDELRLADFSQDIESQLPFDSSTCSCIKECEEKTSKEVLEDVLSVKTIQSEEIDHSINNDLTEEVEADENIISEDQGLSTVNVSEHLEVQGPPKSPICQSKSMSFVKENEEDNSTMINTFSGTTNIREKNNNDDELFPSIFSTSSKLNIKIMEEHSDNEVSRSETDDVNTVGPMEITYVNSAEYSHNLGTLDNDIPAEYEDNTNFQFNTDFVENCVNYKISANDEEVVKHNSVEENILLGYNLEHPIPITTQDNTLSPGGVIIISDDDEDCITKKNRSSCSSSDSLNNSNNYTPTLQSTPYLAKQQRNLMPAHFMNLSPFLQQPMHTAATKPRVIKQLNKPDCIVISDSDDGNEFIVKNNSSMECQNPQFYSHNIQPTHFLPSSYNCPLVYVIYPQIPNNNITHNLHQNGSFNTNHTSASYRPYDTSALDLSKSKDNYEHIKSSTSLSCIKKENVETSIESSVLQNENRTNTNLIEESNDYDVIHQNLMINNTPSMTSSEYPPDETSSIIENNETENVSSSLTESLVNIKEEKVNESQDESIESNEVSLYQFVSQSVQNESCQDIEGNSQSFHSPLKNSLKCLKRKSSNTEINKIIPKKMKVKETKAKILKDNINENELEKVFLISKKGPYCSVKDKIVRNVTLKESTSTSNSSVLEPESSHVEVSAQEHIKTKEQERSDEIQKRIECAKEILRTKELKAPSLIMKNNGKNQASNISKYVSDKNMKCSKKPLSVLDKMKKSVQKQNQSVKFTDIQPVNVKPLVIFERSTKQILDDLKVNNTSVDYISGNKRSRTDSEEVMKPAVKQVKVINNQTIKKVKEPSRLMDVKTAQFLNRKLNSGSLENYQKFNSFIESNVLLEQLDNNNNEYEMEVVNIFTNNSQLSLNESKLKIAAEMKKLINCDVINLITEILRYVHQNAQSELQQNNLVPTAALMIVNLLILEKDKFSFYNSTLKSMMEGVNSRGLITLISINITVLVWLKQPDSIVSFIVDMLTRSHVSMLLLARCLVINVSNMLSSKYSSFINLLKVIVIYEYSTTTNENNKKFLSSLPESTQEFWLNGKNCTNFERCTDLSFVISNVKKVMIEYEKISTKTNWSLLDRIIANKYQ